MEQVIVWIKENGMTVVNIATAVVALASAISAVTPTTKDDSIVNKIKSIVDKLALNVGKAKAKTPDEVKADAAAVEAPKS